MSIVACITVYRVTVCPPERPKTPPMTQTVYVIRNVLSRSGKQTVTCPDEVQMLSNVTIKTYEDLNREGDNSSGWLKRLS